MPACKRADVWVCVHAGVRSCVRATFLLALGHACVLAELCVCMCVCVRAVIVMLRMCVHARVHVCM